MKSRRAKATDISQKVKKVVWERDNHCCICCGSPYSMPNAHYISRAKGGLGIEENVVTLCLRCHNAYDNSTQRHYFENRIRDYLKNIYGEDWKEEKLIYKKEN